MAPGFETMDALVRSKSNPNYWGEHEDATEDIRRVIGSTRMRANPSHRASSATWEI